MRFWIVTYCTLGFGYTLKAQPVINEWYPFGRDQSAIIDVVATDSCYYASAMAKATDGAYWDAGFVKFDFDGNILAQNFLHFPLKSISTDWSNLCPTFDNNFVTLANLDYDGYLLIKFAPNGDTLFTTFVDEMYVDSSLNPAAPGKVLQIPSDSSYMCLGSVFNATTFAHYLILMNISKTGVLNYYQLYDMNDPGFEISYGEDIIQLSDGYLISTEICKNGFPAINELRHVRLVKTDLLGNELWRWTDWDNLLDVYPRGLTQTSDGGFLYGGVSGFHVFNVTWSTLFTAHVQKLNSDLEFEWEIIFGDSLDEAMVNCDDIIEVSDDNFVAVGWGWEDSMGVAWMFNFNLEGEVIWDSYFSYVPLGTLNPPSHYLYDIEKTTDNGFLMSGVAWDEQATFEGIPGSFGWLVKTDSVGCLVPGCQDFLENPEGKESQIKLEIYPNPANNILNIYYYDPEFDGATEAIIYDMEGRKIKSWRLFQNDMTYVVDVSEVETGKYILKSYHSGKDSQIGLSFVKE
jgi:hypothetical protein